MTEEQEPAERRRSPTLEKLFFEARHDPERIRVLEAMERVMAENREVLARLAKS